MPLSQDWETENTIYNLSKKIRVMDKLIYRCSNGFESLVVGETKDTWKLEGNGVKCSVWKDTTKSKIHRVPSDYELKN
jgi:hypothetical protein